MAIDLITSWKRKTKMLKKKKTLRKASRHTDNRPAKPCTTPSPFVFCNQWLLSTSSLLRSVGRQQNHHHHHSSLLYFPSYRALKQRDGASSLRGLDGIFQWLHQTSLLAREGDRRRKKNQNKEKGVRDHNLSFWPFRRDREKPPRKRRRRNNDADARQ